MNSIISAAQKAAAEKEDPNGPEMAALIAMRKEIDALDEQLVQLLSARAAVAKRVGDLKHSHNAPIYRPEREAQVLRRASVLNPGPLPDHSLHTIFKEVMSACRALERLARIAYLGPAGTFSEQAVLAQFGAGVEPEPCLSIDDVFRSVEAGTADFGIVPVENSTEGAVSRTLDLLLTTTLDISAELALPIHHNLLTLSGTLDGVHTVLAHSQALAQCQGWLAAHAPHLKRVAVASNGEGARQAQADPTLAAIAGELAGRTYGLTAVAQHIQDDPHNRTRFAVIGRVKPLPTGKDQTSLILSVPNRPGALFEMLKPFAAHGVSMCRFESRPARTGQWEYFFYVDVEGHAQDTHVAAALADLRQCTSFFKVLGSYPV